MTYIKYGSTNRDGEMWYVQMQRTAVQPDDLSSEPQRSTTRMAVEDEKIISTFEDVFRRIKEATGVTDIQVYILYSVRCYRC